MTHVNAETSTRDSLDVRIIGVANRARNLSWGGLYRLRKIGRETESFRTAARFSAWGKDATTHREALEARAWGELGFLRPEHRAIVFDSMIAEIYHDTLTDEERAVLQRPLAEAAIDG